MAVKFIDRFPELCEAGVGLDFANAGWLTWMLGKAEGGADEGLPAALRHRSVTRVTLQAVCLPLT